MKLVTGFFWGIGNVFSITLYTQQEESFGCLNSIHSGLKLDLRSIGKKLFLGLIQYSTTRIEDDANRPC